jgi:hypothetical protein
MNKKRHMGNNPSSAPTGNTPLDRIEINFSTKTMGSMLSSSLGSTPAIVGSSFRQLTLAIIPAGVGTRLNVNADQPATAIHVAFHVSANLPGLDQTHWTEEVFVSHVPTIEVVHERNAYIGHDNTNARKIRTDVRSTFMRLQYIEQESTLQALVTFIKNLFEQHGTSRIPVKYPGYAGTALLLETNFLPSDPTLFTDSDFHKTRRSSAVAGTNGKPASPGLVSRLGGLGGALSTTMSALAPMLKSRGIDVPDMSGSSPSDPENLMAFISKMQPALAMLQKLTVAMQG